VETESVQRCVLCYFIIQSFSSFMYRKKYLMILKKRKSFNISKMKKFTENDCKFIMYILFKMICYCFYSTNLHIKEMLTQLKKIGSVSVVSYATYFQDKFFLEEAPRINVGQDSPLIIFCICCWLRPK
jgi:hypothetical protein